MIEVLIDMKISIEKVERSLILAEDGSLYQFESGMNVANQSLY